LADIAFTAYDTYHAYRSGGLKSAGQTLAFAAALSIAPGSKAFSKGYSFVKGVKAAEVGGELASSAKQAANLSEHLRNTQKYGKSGYKELENGRIRYYGDLKAANKPGEMAAARYVREWNYNTGSKRDWYEILDHSGNIRSVAPKPPSHELNHHIFDRSGNYMGRR